MITDRIGLHSVLLPLLTIHIRSNLFMDTGVRDLRAVFFKANSTGFNDICNKDLLNRPIYAVLNTYT